MGKRVLALLLVMCLVVGTMSLNVNAASVEASGTCGDNLTWELTSDGTLTISGTGEMTDYKAYGDYTDHIRPDVPWAASRNSVNTLIVEEGVTSIGRNAFYYFHSLESVSLPSTLKTIHANAFYNISKFRGLTLPDGLETLEPGAFGACTYFRWISLPESLVNFTSSAFSGCSNIGSVYYRGNLDQWQALGIRFGKDVCVYPQRATPDDPVGICLGTCGDIDWLCMDGVLRITGTGYMPAFTTNNSATLPPWPQRGITSVVIGSGVNSVGDNAFAFGPDIVEVILPNTIKTIGDGAFNDCASLQQIDLPDGLLQIGDNAFNSSSITELTIPSSVTSIGKYAFAWCRKLTSIKLSDTVTNIETSTFYDCSALETVSIPSNVSTIGESAFGSCNALTDVYYGGRKAEWQAISIEKVNNGSLLNATIHCSDGDIKGDGTPIDPVTPITPGGIVAFYPENGKVLDKDNPENGTSSTNYADGKLRIFFDKELVNAGGNRPEIDTSVGTLEIHKAADNTVVYQVKSNTDIPFWAEGGVSGKAVRIEHATPTLDYNTEYYVTMPAGFIKFKDGSTSPAIAKGEWEFRTAKQVEQTDQKNPQKLMRVENGKFQHASSITKRTEEYTFPLYDESWFLEKSTKYNHDLATMSLAMAMAAYDTKGINGTKRAENILSLFKELNYKSTEESIHYKKPTSDSIGYAIGSKNVTDGKDSYTLIAVAVRGGNYEWEWSSNVNVGLSSEHQGFSNAANMVVEAVKDYIKSTGANRNIKIWISGYSRGAATANLAAQRLDVLANTNQIPGLVRDSIFAYCFECPQNVQNNSSGVTSTLTDNIFNIVNYIDLVPKVAPSSPEWGYTRYGLTYYLPSAEQMRQDNFIEKFERMQGRYSTMIGTNVAQKGYTNSFKGQGQFFDLFVDTLADFLSDPTVYTMGYQKTMMDTLGNLNGGDWELGAIVTTALGVLAPMQIIHPYYTDRLLLHLSDLAHAHYAELCYAWMWALNDSSEFAFPGVRNVIINCPVNVKVYDSKGKLVAMIEENIVKDISNSTTAAFIDENEQKVVVLPTDEEFTIQLDATDYGTVTYTATEYNIDTGKTEKVVSYYEVDVEKGDTLTGTAENLDNVSSAKYPLTLNSEKLEPTLTQEGDKVQDFTVNVTASGNGTVTGGGCFVNGEFSKVTATASSGEEFLGWYVGDQLVSGDSEYRFLVDKQVEIVGKFTQNTKPSAPNYPSTPSTTHYDITVSTTSNGTITVTLKSATKDTTVTLTATPDAGYEPETVAVTGADGKKLALQNIGNNKYTFTMPESQVTVTATFGPAWDNPFTDVGKESWYYPAVKFANQNELMNGVGDGLFCPGNLLTRAQLAQILYNKEGRPTVTGNSTFTDVKAGQWYTDAVTWAQTSGVVAGYDDGRFGPDDNITREQLVTMLWRYTGNPHTSLNSLEFTDAAKASDYAMDALLWAVDKGILNGKGGGVLDPRGSASRAEAAQVLMQLVRNT